MKTLVTGATGFIGCHVVRQLLAQGREVRILLRRDSPTLNIDGLEVERHYGDLNDPAQVREAMRGCSRAFHVAALYAIWRKNPQDFYDANVQGTVNILEAARELGVERVVYTSSVAAVGYEPDGSLGSETTRWNFGITDDHYTISKRMAEIEAMRYAALGVPVVVVNPSGPIGSFDSKPTPTGRIIVDVVKGRLPFYVNAWLNLIDVEDVARGHLLAEERGQVGQRYLLTNANLTLGEVCALLKELTGRRGPLGRVPNRVPELLGAFLGFVQGDVFGSEPFLTKAAGKITRLPFKYDNTRAVRELGLECTPIRESFVKAIEWYRQHGYIK